MAIAKAKPRKPKRRTKSAPQPTKRQRQQVIATQHGILFAAIPLIVLALVAQGSLTWEQVTDAVLLAWSGNIAGGCLRYFA